MVRPPVKVLAPAAGATGQRVLELLEEAAREFNRTLDIRLRFLDIGIDLIPVRPLRGQPGGTPDAWRTRIGHVIERERPRLLLVHVADPTAGAAAAEAAEREVRLVALVAAEDAVAGEAVRDACPAARLIELGDLEAAGEGRRLVEVLVAERATS